MVKIMSPNFPVPKKSQKQMHSIKYIPVTNIAYKYGFFKNIFDPVDSRNMSLFFLPGLKGESLFSCLLLAF